jgi:hypothetical protein
MRANAVIKRDAARLSATAFACLLVALAPRSAAADRAAACVAASERGQELAYQHKLLAAREQLRACARPECPTAVAQDCAAELARVTERIPTIVLAAHDADGPVSSVRAVVDGSLVVTSLDGRAIEIDPGIHTFHFEATGRAAVDMRVPVSEGSRLERVDARFEVPSGSTSTATSGAPWHVPLGALVLGGVGVIGLAGGTYFGVEAVGEHSRLSSSAEVTQHDLDTFDAHRHLSTVGFAVGVLALGAAAWIFARSLPPRSTHALQARD